MNTLCQLMTTAEQYVNYLSARNVRFESDGFPCFETDMFIKEYPHMVVPFDYRNSRFVTCKNKTLLCFFCSDDRIYPRIDKLEHDIPTYRKYMGVVGFDLTVTADMDPEWQDFLMLCNSLFTAVLAVNGISVAYNLRMGADLTIKNFTGIPADVVCASGFLGCDKTKYPFDYSYLKKVLTVKPSKLILYGKHDPLIDEHLSLCGVDFRVFPDVHSRSKGVRTNG